MSRGGDRRPLVRELMSQESLAALLLQQMYRLDNEFASQWDSLFERFERLVVVLKDHDVIGEGRPHGGLRNLLAWIERVQHPIPVNFPSPRPATERQLVEHRHRQQIESVLNEQLYRNWPPARGRPEHDDRFIHELDQISQWTFAPLIDPTRIVHWRRSRRIRVRRYFEEIEQFARRWGLEAWWAVPAVAYSHFIRARTGDSTPLLLLISDCELINYYPLTVALPNTHPEYFPLEQHYFANLHVERRLIDVGLPDVNLRHRPTRSEMELIERRLGASTVTYDWEPASERHPVEQLVLAVERRLGQPLNRTDDREVRRCADEQVSAIQANLRSTGRWRPRATIDHESHAEWLAWKLLDPALTWVEIAARHCYPSGELPHSDMVGREARRFAGEAGLELSR